jgi:hypothetical protein
MRSSAGRVDWLACMDGVWRSAYLDAQTVAQRGKLQELFRVTVARLRREH